MVIKVLPPEEREAQPKAEICDLCGKPEPDPLLITFSFNNEIELIKPQVDFTRKEFEDWQNKHVMSQHMTYEEFLAQ